MRITLRVEIDPEALRKDAQIVAPDATAADIRQALGQLAAIEIENALASSGSLRQSVQVVR
jgi:hypothetical protein